MQQPGNGMLTGFHHSMRNVNPRTVSTVSTDSARPALPDRNVSADTIEEVYVRFILYCNPGVPLDTDTSALREAFRTPPKSGGKSFSTFTLFELIKLLESKEIKTWAELALRLGVEAPEKGQSSQKIQQYAVRLKRWMHSMHVDAFFEYLLDNSHPYWTQIPLDSNLVADSRRDGVAPEDDMALRSLLPQIRPRRGRKRPDDEDLSRSPTQRPRMDSESMGTDDLGGPRTAVVEQLDLWSAQPDSNRGAFLFPPADQYSHMNMSLAPGGSTWTGGDFTQTPLTAHPFSAITSSTRNAFWPDQSGEPKSALSQKVARLNKRHGAKVVSSAWRSGVSGGTGKTRGRPPINRSSSNEAPYSAFLPDHPTFNTNVPMNPSMPPSIMTPSTSNNTAPVAPSPQVNIEFNQQQDLNNNTQNQVPRPPRNRLSLQVPPRVGGEVRLATPPLPTVTLNGQATQTSHDMNHHISKPGQIPLVGNFHALDAFESTAAAAAATYTPLEQQAQPQIQPQSQTRSHSLPQSLPQSQPHASTSAPPSRGVQFADPNDRTNMDELESFFIYEFLSGDWYDANNNPIPPCTVEEAVAISSQILENVMQGAATKEMFLINIAALAGGSILKSTSNLQVYRTEESPESTSYSCHWQLQLGDIKGMFSMREIVSHNRWKRDNNGDGDSDNNNNAPAAGGDDDSVPAPGDADSRHWHQKYTRLLEITQQQKAELSEFRKNVVMVAKPPAGKPPDRVRRR